jgi:hypothetical protein
MSGHSEMDAGRRAAIYRSAAFRSQVSGAFGRDPKEIANLIDTLLEEGCIPLPVSNVNDEPIRCSDAAIILIAHAGRQQRPASVVRVTTRICEMRHQFDVGRRGSGYPAPRESFGAEMSDLLRRAGDSESGLAASAAPVQILWSEGGKALFATIDCDDGRKRLFADARLPKPLGGTVGNWDFVRLPTVGGTLLSPQSLMSFAEIFRTKFGPAPSDPTASPNHTKPEATS